MTAPADTDAAAETMKLKEASAEGIERTLKTGELSVAGVVLQGSKIKPVIFMAVNKRTV